MHFLPRLVAPAVALAALACGGGDLVLPSSADPAEIIIVEGDNQVGSAGLPLDDSLVVRVEDQNGRVMAGVQIVFTLADGGQGGNVSPGTVLTDSRGEAAAQWTLGGTSGSQAVDAAVAGGSLTTRFRASAGTSGPRRLEAVSGDQQSAPVGTALSDSLVVRVVDEFGNPVAGVGVAWTASAGGVSPATATTGANGQAAARRILGSTAGTQTAEARADGLEGSPVTFVHTARPGTAASLVLISGSDQTGPRGEELPEPLVVRLVDESGNGIPGQAVTWLVATGGGSVSPSSSDTDGDGFASARWTLGPTATTNTLNAVVSSASGERVVQFTATGSGNGGGGGDEPSANRSTVSADPTSFQALIGSSTITVTVLDGSGDPVAGATVLLSATGSGNQLTQPAGPTGGDGVATGTLTSSVPGTKEISATVNGLVEINETARVEVTLAPASRIELVAGDGQTATAGEAVPIPPAVRVSNELDQPVAGFPVIFVVTVGGGTVNGASQTTRITNSDGVAQVGNWTLGDPGPNQLEARAASLLGSPVVFNATATPSVSPAGFRFLVQPQDVEEDEPFSQTVQVAIVDGAGNVLPLSGIEIEIDLLEEDGDEQNNDLDGDQSQETVNGVASFPGLSVDNSDEGYRLQASSRDLRDVPEAISDPFDVED